MKFRRYAKGVLLLFVLAPLGYATWLYPSLPDTIPTHFNSSGEADGWGPRHFIFLSPVLLGIASLIVYFTLTNIRKIDPKRYFKDEDHVFNWFSLFISGFLSLLGFVILFATTHAGLPMEKLLFPTLGMAFTGMGFFLPKLRQNYFAGFKLPWTLDNEANWNATHQLAGKLWRWGGLVQLCSGLLLQGKWVFGVFISVTALMVIIPVLFSFQQFRHAQK